MKKFYTVALVLFLILSFGAICYTGCAQTTQLSFPKVLTDLNRPGAGFNEWSYDQNIVNIPTQGVNTQRLDRYWRFTFLDFQSFNGLAGTYDFTIFDQKIQQSITKGQTFSFGVMQQCGGCDANLQGNVSGSVMLYPLWLHTQMQGESSHDYVVGGEWFPNYNSPSYLTAWKNLNIAINAHILAGSFNGTRYRDVIGQIDARGYGDYGEWTNNDFTFTGSGGTVAATIASLDTILSSTIHVYNTFQCVYMMATMDGNQLGNTMVPPAVGFYALQARNAVGPFGWRRDSWGQTDSYLSQWTDTNPTVFGGYHFKDSIMNRYIQAPVVGEPQDGGSAGNFTALPGQMPFYGVTSVGNGNFNNAINATIQNNFRAASAAAGYRILIDTGSMTTTPAAGSTFNVTLKLKNTNGIPPYISWKIVYEWWNGTTLLQRDTSAFDLKGFLSTSDVSFSSNILLRTVPAGTGYSLHVKVVDPLGFRIPMPLFNTGRLADGSYIVNYNITVTTGTGGGGGTPTPVANAGPSQAITLPLNSVTLNGSGSSGTITTYAWSQVSGPNVATIVTPGMVNTVINGLIQGIYIFQLAVDGGSSDTCQVVVSPAIVPPPAPSGVNIFTTQTPNSGTLNDGPQGGIIGIEVGVRFRASVQGYITGVRVYKKQDTTTGRIGFLYSNSGTILAQATFTNEGANGWQTVQFNPAVAIVANTTYVAAVFSPSGNYISTNNYFTGAISNLPVIGLGDGTDGHNGIYKYTASPAFPISYYSNHQPNYWVDPYFTANNPGTLPGHFTGGTIYFQAR